MLASYVCEIQARCNFVRFAVWRGRRVSVRGSDLGMQRNIADCAKNSCRGLSALTPANLSDPTAAATPARPSAREASSCHCPTTNPRAPWRIDPSASRYSVVTA